MKIFTTLLNFFFSLGNSTSSTSKSFKRKPLFLFHGRKIRREISGSLANKLDLDYTLPLDELKAQVDIALDKWLKEGKHFSFSQHMRLHFSDGLYIHQGGSHIDVCARNKGSLNILTVLDHHI